MGYDVGNAPAHLPDSHQAPAPNGAQDKDAETHHPLFLSSPARRSSPSSTATERARSRFPRRPLRQPRRRSAVSRADDYRHHILATASGSTVHHTSPSRIYEFRTTLPPLDEQRAIAGVLGALDDKIEQNQQTAWALERLARATFRAWFVGFEPVKAKAAGADSFPFHTSACFRLPAYPLRRFRNRPRAGRVGGHGHRRCRHRERGWYTEHEDLGLLGWREALLGNAKGYVTPPVPKTSGTRGRWVYKQMIGESYGEYGSGGLCDPGPSGRFEPSQVGKAEL